MAATTLLPPDRRQPAELVPAGGRRRRPPRGARVLDRLCARVGDPAGGLLALGLAARPSASSSASGRTSPATRSCSPVSGAKEVDETTAPQLMNVVREMAIAANVPMPQGLRHRRHGARTPSRPAATRSTRRWRSRPACSRSSTARSSRASSATSCRTSATSTSGSRSSSGSWSAPSPSSPTSSCASRSGAASAVGRDRDSGGSGGGAQAIMFVVAIVLAILAPIISRFIQLAVNRQREYLADASSVELTRNPYGLERALAKISGDHGGARGRQPRHPAHVLHEPDQEVRGALVGPDVDPPGDPRPDQSAARADRRPAARHRPRRRRWRGSTRVASVPCRRWHVPRRPVVSCGPPTGSQRGWPSGRGSSVGRARD